MTFGKFGNDKIEKKIIKQILCTIYIYIYSIIIITIEIEYMKIHQRYKNPTIPTINKITKNTKNLVSSFDCKLQSFHSTNQRELNDL